MTTDDAIASFCVDQPIEGYIVEIPNTSLLYPPPGRCYRVLLTREGTEADVQVFTGPGVEEMTLASALWNLCEDAERYGGLDPFDQWNQENDEGYYVEELGYETAVRLYEHCRAVYFDLLSVLGEDLYRALVDLIYNG